MVKNIEKRALIGSFSEKKCQMRFPTWESVLFLGRANLSRHIDFKTNQFKGGGVGCRWLKSRYRRTKTTSKV